MASICNYLINQCISADCEKPLYAGVGGEALIGNFEDIATVTHDQTNGSIVNGITMKTDTCMYTVQQLGNQPFADSNTTMVEGTYGNRVQHEIHLAVVDNGPEITENVIDKLLNGKFFCILTNDYRHENGDNKYQIYGLNKGLKCTAMERQFYGNNESAYVITLTETGAGKSGQFLYSTDEATTDTLYETLKCDCGDTQNNATPGEVDGE